jgi:hypothetical protein
LSSAATKTREDLQCLIQRRGGVSGKPSSLSNRQKPGNQMFGKHLFFPGTELPSVEAGE